MRRLLSTFGLAITLLVMAASVATALTTSRQAEAAAAPQLDITFTTPDGDVQDTPYFDVSGAFPGMLAQTTVVTLRNTGTAAVEYDVNVRTPAANGSLADVLVMSVRPVDGGPLAYRGPLGAASVRGASNLQPGSAVSYSVSITWPDGGPADNAYQGAELSFDIVARAREAA